MACLLEQEIERRERALYQCALDVEANVALREEMKDWETAVGDEIDVRTLS